MGGIGGADTKSFQIAQQLQAKVEAGETITAQDLGKLYRENVLTIEQEEQAEATRQEAETNIETAEHPTGETVNTDRPVDLVRPEPADVVESGQQAAQNVPVAVENRGMQAPAETEGVAWAGTEEASRGTETQVQEEMERRGAPQTTERTVLNDGRQQATPEGDHLHDGDAGRLYGPSAGEQGGRLAGGAVQTGGSAEQGRVAVERQNYAKSLRRQRVSSAEGLGLAMGTDTPSVTVLEEGDWDAGMRATAERVQRETGCAVTYVLGSIPIRTSGGGTTRVRGVYTQDGRIILQADHMRLSTDQIADHEIFHDKAFQTPGMVREIEARITERFGQEEFEKIVTTYIEKLRGVIDLPADADGAAIDAAYVAIMEEIFADAYAGINAFGAHAEQYNETVEGIMAERGVARRSQETAAATDRRTGPPAESTGEQYSVNESFGQELEEWDDAGRPEGERFILGSTGDVLQGLGAVEADIFMEGDKISTILENHPEMTLEEIERVPEILDDPVLVMKSQGSNRRGQNTRLVVFGSFKATNGQPIMSVLDLRPVEGGFAVADMQKVNSAYTRDNALNYIQGGEILHADKKRTIPLLRTVGLHGPIELQRSGSMGSISYNGQNVNIQGTPFEDVVRQGEQEAEDIDGAESMTERGRKERFSLEEPDADGEGRELDKKRAELEEMEARLKELNGERYKAFLTIQQYKTSDAYKDMIDRIDKVDGADLDALVSEMEEREKSLGISEANRRYGELTGEIKNLSAQVEERKKEVRKAALEEARGQYTPAFAKEYADAAEDEFGTTDDFSLAGYLDTNGELLDFSEGQGQRVQDHREIADVLDFLPDGYEYSDPLIEFMNLGNIRIMSAGVEIAVEPNERQREQLLRFFEERNGEVTVDFSDQDGRNRRDPRRLCW